MIVTRSLQVFISLLALLMSFSVAEAQKKQHYDSLYEALPGLWGEASFAYYVDKKGQRLKDGAFTFVSRSLDSLCNTKATYYGWSGFYENGKKEGAWNYSKRRHEATLHDFSYTRLDYSLQTVLEKLTGKYVKGLPNGLWKFRKSFFEGKEEIFVLQEGNFNFKEGLVDGDVYFLELSATGQDTLNLLRGQATAGLMTGEWHLRYKGQEQHIVNEVRHYEKGVLKHILHIQQEDTLSLKLPLSPMITESITSKTLSKNLVNRPLSLIFNDGYPRESPLITAQHEGNRSIKKMLAIFGNYDPSLGQTLGLALGTNRGHYPLTSKEKKALESWLMSRKEIQDKVLKIEEEAQANVNYQQDSTLREVKEWSTLQREILDHTDPWAKTFASGDIEFYYREGELVNYASRLLSADSLLHTSLTYPTNDAKNFLDYIAKNFELRKSVGDSLLKTFENRVQYIQVKEDIAERKVGLEKQHAKVDSLFSQKNFYPKVQHSIDTLKERFLEKGYNESFQLFLKSNPTTQRLISDEMQLELETLQKIHGLAQKVTHDAKRLDSLYTEYTFDPFTFSDRVPVRVKRVLYETVTLELLPWLLSKAEREKEALKVFHRFQEIDELQLRLFIFRQKRTKSLERKLRRSETPEERIELLLND